MNWLKMIWGAVKGAVSATNVGEVLDTLGDLYAKRAAAKNDAELAQLDAEIELVKMRAKQTANLQGYWLTAWIRPAFAAAVFFYVGKALVWDAALHLGTTDAVEGVIEWAVVAVVGFYFLTRPFEKGLWR
ncbi:MAG: hypothetical protein KDK11_11610 [Maritimibacter sp.]|nr:hypothetical protein [Maritimibacter sp.]